MKDKYTSIQGPSAKCEKKWFGHNLGRDFCFLDAIKAYNKLLRAFYTP